MENTQTLGQIIGKVRHTFSITNDAGDKVQLAIWIDYSTATNTDVIGWVVSNRVIAGQRPWRALSKGELEALDNTTIMATEIGRKVKSRAEKIATYMATGLTEDFAIMALDEPVKFAKAQAMVEQIMAEQDELHDDEQDEPILNIDHDDEDETE